MPEQNEYDIHREIGRLEAEVQALNREQAAQNKLIGEMARELKAMRSLMDQRSGGIRALLVAVSVGATLGTITTMVVQALGVFTKGGGS